MTLPALTDVRAHLNDATVDAAEDVELQGMLDAAVELVGAEIGMSPVDIAGRPALRLAILELVRDIWTGTQSGGGGREFGDEGGDLSLPFSAGRPTLPPYVRGLLRPYLTGARVPLASFPDAATWPDAHY